MWRHSCVARSTALSPYAQALKQVALKGVVAMGPSAKEMEIEMYRRGSLPADYRPPAQGKWDDTIERWAYAWQFPAEEDGDDVVASVEKNDKAMQELLEFGERLASSPPSTVPRSGRRSTAYAVTLPPRTAPLPLPAPSHKYASLESDLDDLGTPHAAEAAVEDGVGRRSVMAVEQFSEETSIPIAYLDDESERTNASKELSVIMGGAGLDLTEEDLVVVLAALARQHYYDAALAIFRFAAEVGLGPTAEMYKALMKHSSSQGKVNDSMALIEEMKGRGITPRIGNWHELMRSFHNARDYAAVAQIADNMKMYANIEPNEVTFALQLRALGKDTSQMNSLAESVQLFDQMENVYGFIASRPHYDALMFSLSQSPLPEMRLRCEELAQKMELMGIPWNATTYLNLIRAAQVVGDVDAVERHLAKMRDARVPASMLHLSWAIQAHVQHLIRADYEQMKEQKQDLYATWLEHMNTCFGIYELVVRRGREVHTPFVNALLRLCCQTTILCVEHLPDNAGAIGKFEEQANKIWSDTFDEWHIKKDVYSYECYIALLAHQQRIDEAERLLQQMVLQEELVPSRRTYECLIFMHLSSGEEGGAARALHYLEAMERARVPVRASLLKKIVRVNDAAGYKRDMKRRARRIMQAREEYLARKQEGVGFPLQSSPASAVAAEAADVAAAVSVVQPLPIAADTTLAWWAEWKRTTVSKHELFAEENTDGTPKGETFEEKNAALAQLGIDSVFKTPADVPALGKQQLLPKIRKEEGEVAGGLWALDGGELAYPKDGGGPQGWGVRLWRERAIVKAAFQDVLDGKAAAPEFSAAGTAVRVAGDQLDIEESGATTPAELSDWRRYPHHRYDDGSMKPASEMAHAVPPSAELVWQGERRDALAPYKSDAEIAMESDNTFYAKMNDEAATKTAALVEVLHNKEEDAVMLTGQGATRRSKYDYLQKWREMYRHGTLEAPEKPPLRFGRSPDDHHDSLASSVRDWYSRNRKAPATQPQLHRWEAEETRSEDERLSKKALQRSRRRRHRSR
ncbi:Pentatricopeptide repeat domain containing protein [Novymonas esmeraldas]|uniref:Pentatricopeptide repeat domain containing protein n=1 Tax=Novymonas esmeraldas TaxID=1808958 RepID=A0AAW0EVS4_9TRYP